MSPTGFYLQIVTKPEDHHNKYVSVWAISYSPAVYSMIYADHT